MTTPMPEETEAAEIKLLLTGRRFPLPAIEDERQPPVDPEQP